MAPKFAFHHSIGSLTPNPFEFADDLPPEGSGIKLPVPHEARLKSRPRVLGRSLGCGDREVYAATRLAGIDMSGALSRVPCVQPDCDPIRRGANVWTRRRLETGGTGWPRPVSVAAGSQRRERAGWNGRAPLPPSLAAGSNALAPYGRGEGRDTPRRRAALTPSGLSTRGARRCVPW